MFAAEGGHLEVVRELIEGGAELNTQGSVGCPIAAFYFVC